MKMYSIPKGSECIAIKNPLSIADMHSKQHFTRYDLEFFETLTDPVAVRNGRKSGNPVLDGLASMGYAIFMSSGHNGYALAVLYKEVEVL
jgi:hypothetical protein